MPSSRSATGDLRVPPASGLPFGLTIPGPELSERFSRSSGPGGQSVNTTDSRVELSWDIAESAALNDQQRARLLQRLHTRMVDGVITLAAAEQRSQLQNRIAARERLSELVAEALAPVVLRRPTKPSRASRQRRLDSKHQRSEVKATRRRPPPE